MMLDLSNDIEVRRLIDADEGAGSDTAKVSQTLDLANVAGCVLAIITGTLADANATFTVLVEDSPDGSAWTAVPDAFLVGTESGASFIFSDDNETRKIGYIGPQRYLRLTITPSGNTGAWDIAACAIVAHGRKLPQTSQG